MQLSFRSEGIRYCANRWNKLSSEIVCSCKRNQNRSCALCFSSCKESMIDIEINKKELDDIQKTFWNKAIVDILDRSIKKSVILLQRYAMEETPVDEGRLRSWFQTELKPFYWRVFNPVEYAIFVHEWTKPHKAPRNNIEARALRHWLNPWSVWISIMRKWTKANPFMERAVERWEEQVDEIFSKEIDKFFNEQFK